MSAVAVATVQPVAQTERGTPVYALSEDIPFDMLPRAGSGRGIGTPPPQGPLAKWLAERFPAPSCVIIRWRRFTRIIKLSERGDIISVSSRSLLAADRTRLIAAGILSKT